MSNPESPATQTHPEERRFATVLTVALCGIGPILSATDVGWANAALKILVRALERKIEEFGGYVVAHYSGELQAVWGAPSGVEHDAERAVSCALSLEGVLPEVAAELDRPEAAQLQLCLGLATGQVLCSYLGQRRAFTLLGEAVDMSRKLVEQGEPGTVLMSHTTYRIVRGVYRVRRIEDKSGTGRTSAHTIFEVEQKLEQPTRVRYASEDGLETRLVGRDELMSDLLDLYEALHVASDPFLGLLIGETGMGKSRILMEFGSQIEGVDPRVNFLSVRGLPEAQRSPFYIWKSLWKNRFGIQENMDPDEACELFLRGVLHIWGKRLGNYSAVEAAHLIGDLIGLEWKNSPYLRKYRDDPEAGAQRAFKLIREILVRMSESGPIILLIDDLQWLDQGSLNLLADLIQPEADPLPIFILASSRPDFTNRNFSWLNLAYRVLRLGPVEFTPEMVRTAYPVLAHFPDALLARMKDRAGGSPYFMEEIVKSMVQADPETDPASIAVPSIAHPIPDNLIGLLQDRLDVLPQEAREVLQLASVSGRIFWVGAVKAAARQPVGTGLLNLPEEVLERAIRNALRHVVRAELAFPRTDSIFEDEQEYIFKHQMLQEVAYETLPEKYRKFYHFAVARWLAERASPDFNVLIAQHFEKAGNISSALRHYQFAHEYATRRGAVWEVEWLNYHMRSLRRPEGENGT